MKTITSLFLILALFIITSCEGPMGPQGPAGQDGVDIMGTVVQIVGDFTPENNYMLYYAFADDNIEVYDGDVVLVYILWKTASTTDGGTIDVWRLLPQTVVLDGGGVLQYNYDHTYADVQIFLEGDLTNLLPAETDNQNFRIAVLPATLLQNNNIDITDINAVMKSMDLNLNSIKEVNPSIHLN